LHVAVGLIYTI